MRIISFAETSPALLAHRKTVTRRDWANAHALGFAKGDLVQAWNKDTRVKGAEKIGIIRLTADPYLEEVTRIPESDYEAEGFAYLYERAMNRWLAGGAPISHAESYFAPDAWRSLPTWGDAAALYVVRFEIVEIYQPVESLALAEGGTR